MRNSIVNIRSSEIKKKRTWKMKARKKYKKSD